MCGGCIIIIEDVYYIDNRLWNLWCFYCVVLELKGNFVFIFNVEEGFGMGEVLVVNV